SSSKSLAAIPFFEIRRMRECLALHTPSRFVMACKAVPGAPARKKSFSSQSPASEPALTLCRLINLPAHGNPSSLVERTDESDQSLREVKMNLNKSQDQYRLLSHRRPTLFGVLFTATLLAALAVLTQ